MERNIIMKNCVTPNQTQRESDNLSIQAAIALAKENGCNCVVIPSYNERTRENKWVFEDTVYLPGDIEIIIDDAYLVLADGIYANMFASDTLLEGKGRTKADEIKNITVRGIGNAVLDGGNYNGLSERNSAKDGRPHISKNTTMLFFNVSNLTVENISVINQRWWGITNIFVHHAVYRNINFAADYSRMDENGVHHPDEFPKNYNEIYIKNADGIDLRVGCHDFLIENITGFCEDDVIALTALGKFETRLGYIVEGESPDIRDVKIKNINANTACSVVRLLNDEGNKLYNIDVDGVMAAYDKRTSAAVKPIYTVRIGDMAYAKEHSSLGDTYSIKVRNVVVNTSCGINICKGLKDSLIENVIVTEGGQFGVAANSGGAQFDNCVIRNIVTAGSGSVAVKPGGYEGTLTIE